MKTKFAATRALRPLCLLLAFLVLNGCSDLKKAVRLPGDSDDLPQDDGYVVVEGRLSAAIDEATLPASIEYVTANGPKIGIVTLRATVNDGRLELLSHALMPNACKVTLALTPSEAETLKLFFANEQICRYVSGKEPVMCAHFVAEGHEYRVLSAGKNVRLGGCTVEGYEFLCDSMAAYGASDFLKNVVIPSKAPVDCVPL